MSLSEAARPRQSMARWWSEERRAQAHFFLLGVAILLLWNSFITAVDYFSKVFPGEHVDRVFSVAYMSVNICSIALNMHIQRVSRAPTRLITGLVGYVASLALVPAADSANAADWLSDSRYKAVLIGGVVSAAFWDGVAQPAVFGEAGELPVSCVQVCG